MAADNDNHAPLDRNDTDVLQVREQVGLSMHELGRRGGDTNLRRGLAVDAPEDPGEMCRA